jgi:hypothetical protein
VSWRGRWYLIGYDLVRGAERVFRLSRVTGPLRPVGKPGTVTVPPGVDLHSVVSARAPVERTGTATLRIRPGTGHTLRRHARILEPANPLSAAEPLNAADFPDGSAPTPRPATPPTRRPPPTPTPSIS